MELGIALDGDGRLGRPAAVTALAQAADRLGYGSVWCIGPWAASLVGAVAAVTERVRIGLETTSSSAGAARAVGGDRLVVSRRLLLWSPSADPGSRAAPSGPVRLDARATDLAAALDDLCAARADGITEVVVRLLDDPGVDEALAAYAELGESVEGTAAGRT